MTRFAGSRLDSDNGYADGTIFLGPDRFLNLGSGTFAATRNAQGDISINAGASQSGILVTSLSNILFRTGLLDDLQEAFGSGGNQPGLLTGLYGTGSALHGAAGQKYNYPTAKLTAQAVASAGAVILTMSSNVGFTVGQAVSFVTTGSPTLNEMQRITNVNVDGIHMTVAQLKSTHAANTTTVAGNPFITPTGVSGRPPYTGVTDLVPLTSPRAKGVNITDMIVYYLNGTNNLTSFTIGISQIMFANAAALLVTNTLAPAQNGLVLTAAATPYATRVAVNSGWLVSDQTEYILELTPVTPAGGTFRFYGVTLHVQYNFN